MKELFGASASKQGDLSVSCTEFVVKRVESWVSARQTAMTEEGERLVQRASPPKWLIVLAIVLLLAGEIAFSVGISFLTEGEVVSGFIPLERKIAPILIGAGAGIVVLSFAFLFYLMSRLKKLAQSPFYLDYNERSEKLARDARENLLVPESSPTVDVLLKVEGKFFGVRMKAYSVYPFRAFRDGEALCLSEDTFVVRIPWDAIEAIERVQKRIAFSGWNKSEGFRAGRYKRYKIHRDSNDADRYMIKPYYRLRVRGTEELVVRFPGYEFETLAPVLGRKAESVTEIDKEPSGS